MREEWTVWHEKHSDKIELVAGIDCWIWTGASGSHGYGRVSYNRKSSAAHRVAYIESGGDFANGNIVRHMCANPYCVRPSHLKSGTSADNAKDMSQMFNGVGRLVELDVFEICQMYKDSVSLAEIARRKGIAYGTVYPIVIGKSYKHVRREHVRALRSPPKVKPEIVADIRRRLQSGDGPQSKLAAEYGVSQAVISRINTGAR